MFVYTLDYHQTFTLRDLCLSLSLANLLLRHWRQTKQPTRGTTYVQVHYPNCCPALLSTPRSSQWTWTSSHKYSPASVAENIFCLLHYQVNISFMVSKSSSCVPLPGQGSEIKTFQTQLSMLTYQGWQVFCSFDNILES